MKKIKSTISFLLALALLVGTIPCVAAEISNDTNIGIEIVNLKQPIIEKISSKEYEDYSKYDIMITENALEIEDSITELKYKSIEKELNKQIKLQTKNLGNTYYETYQYDKIDKKILDFESIVEIAFIKDGDTSRYIIDYNTKNSERVILEYFNNGMENKTIYNKLTDEIVSVNNQNEKISYGSNYIKETSLELSEDQLLRINDLINQDNIKELKLIEGIEVQEVEGSIIVNLIPEDNANFQDKDFITLSAPTNKSNAFPITSSFPIITSKVLSSKNVISSALQYYNKPDCNVYAKVIQKRNNYIQETFDLATFGATTALSIIGIYLGAGTTVVSQMCYYAGILTGLVGTIQSIKEIADIAKDAKYTYTGEKSGYVYDKTVFNNDVKIITNIAQGTFDGGLLPNGQWAWIESPQSSAYSANDTTILNNCISNYNSAIWWGEGYCTQYLPE